MKNLEYFSEEFQYEAVKALIEDTTLMGRVYKILDQNAFSNAALRTIVGVCKEFYKNKGTAIDYVSLKIIGTGVCKTDDSKTEVLQAIALIKAASSIGQDTIEDSLIKFFKLKHLAKIANKIIDDINSNETDDLIIKRGVKGFEDVANLGKDESETTFFNEATIVNACTSGDNDVVPTGITKLDELLAGGLGRQEIGLFVAPTGYGKTTAGTIFAHNAATQGYKALQIYFEDRPQDIVRKHIAMATSTNSNFFRKLDEEVAKEISNNLLQKSDTKTLSENLILCKMPDAETTVEDIDNKIKELINLYGFHPDMIVIDYFSSLRHSENLNRDPIEAQTRCMKKIKEMIAYKYNAAVWVMQQTNRQAVSKEGDASGMGNWQGAYAATQPASVWITLQRSKEQKQNFRADLIFNKTRHSQPKEDLLDIVFDNAKLQIDCDEPASDPLSWEDSNEDYQARFGN